MNRLDEHEDDEEDSQKCQGYCELHCTEFLVANVNEEHVHILLVSEWFIREGQVYAQYSPVVVPVVRLLAGDID